MKRLTPTQWTWAFGTYAYTVTVVSAAWVAVRNHAGSEPPLTYAAALLWQGLVYGLWLPAAALVWLIIRRFGPRPEGVMAFMLLGLLAVPTHALLAGTLDIAFSPTAGPQDRWALLERRLPVGVLLFTALGAVGLAAALQRRASEAARRAQGLAEALRAAREVSTAPTVATAPPHEKLLVSAGSRRVPVDPSEVEWFASAGNYVVVNWNGREGLIRETLSALEARLDPAVFARSHRSTIVNLARVRETASLSDGSWRLVMESGVELVASRTYRDAVLSRLGRS